MRTVGGQTALLFSVLSVILVITSACGQELPPVANGGEITLALSSTAFKEGEQIPVKYTCDGQDISPPLDWSGPPSGTQALVLIVDDPDAPAGVFTHWILFNIRADTHRLPEGIPAQQLLEKGALPGKNGFGEIGYGGPCPPAGRAHRYRFTIYALDKPLDLKSGAAKKQVLNAMEGHILAQGQLTGKYQR